MFKRLLFNESVKMGRQLIRSRKKNRKRGFLRGTVTKRRQVSNHNAIYKQIQPKLYYAKMKFFQNQNLTINPPNNTGTTTSAQILYSANGLFDPQVVPVGAPGQPSGFDQMMALYRHYTVVSSKIKIKIFPNVNENPMSYGIIVVDSNPGTLGIRRLAEQYGARVRNTANLGVAGAPTNYVTLTKTWSAKKSEGKRRGKDLVSNDDLYGTITTNPSEEYFFHAEVQPLVASTDPSPMNVQVEILYNVIFHEPHPLVSST